jgi:hypothetical protein
VDQIDQPSFPEPLRPEGFQLKITFGSEVYEVSNGRMVKTSRSRGAEHKLRVSAEIPDWADEEGVAQALADFIRALGKLHRAMGGSGLAVDGMEVGTDVLEPV